LSLGLFRKFVFEKRKALGKALGFLFRFFAKKKMKAQAAS